MLKPRIAAWTLLAAGIVFLALAIMPLRRGDSVNFPLLLLAAASIVLAPIVAKKAGGATASKPPAA